jgi:hypothetical protein
MGVKQYNGWIATEVGQRQIRVVGHRARPEAAAGLSAEEGGEKPDVGVDDGFRISSDPTDNQ